MIEQVNQQLKKVHDIAKEHGYITLQEACHAVCWINGIKYSYELNKGTTVVNISLEELAKILRVYEIVDNLYKSGKIKLSDLKE